MRWILDNGLHCANGGLSDPNFIPIGNAELIERRAERRVPTSNLPLSDYIPFYFTPFSPMMYNIKTGRAGVLQRKNDDVIILVSSLRKLAESRVEYVFSDRHAYLKTANFFCNLSDLEYLDWDSLQKRDFTRDPENPEKFERYQAEALARRHVPLSALLGVACHSSGVEEQLNSDVVAAKVELKVRVAKRWYFE